MVFRAEIGPNGVVELQIGAALGGEIGDSRMQPHFAKGDAIWAWLSEARSAARAKPVEAQLTRTPNGFNGTVVVALGGRP